MAGAFRYNREAVELARQPNRKIADVDHLLHFAQSFLQDLAALDRDETAERRLRTSQLLAETTHEFATLRCWDQAPGQIRLVRGGDRRACIVDGRVLHTRDQ